MLAHSFQYSEDSLIIGVVHPSESHVNKKGTDIASTQRIHRREVSSIDHPRYGIALPSSYDTIEQCRKHSYKRINIRESLEFEGTSDLVLSLIVSEHS